MFLINLFYFVVYKELVLFKRWQYHAYFQRVINVDQSTGCLGKQMSLGVSHDN